MVGSLSGAVWCDVVSEVSMNSLGLMHAALMFLGGGGGAIYIFAPLHF